jgi:hypothetical protein
MAEHRCALKALLLLLPQQLHLILHPRHGCLLSLLLRLLVSPPSSKSSCS